MEVKLAVKQEVMKKMRDKFRLDSHKLMFHPQRVADWKAGNSIAPIYIEVSPTGACNQRCSFCALDFLKHKTYSLDPKLFKKRVKEMAKIGVKSIMMAGEGEPLLHPQITRMIEVCTREGIDVAMTTNGTSLVSTNIEKIVNNLTWIKVSVNGATRTSYKKVHGVDNFEQVMDGIDQLVQYKLTANKECTIGIQFLVLPENEKEIEKMAILGYNIGVDYVVFKPFSQHPLMKEQRYKDLKYSKMLLKKIDFLSRTRKLDCDIVYRRRAFTQWNNKAQSNFCFALPFWSYIDSKGDVWGCSMHIGDQEFFRGNIYNRTAKQIWMREGLPFIINVDECRVNCRMASINSYLEKIDNGIEHINFI